MSTQHPWHQVSPGDNMPDIVHAIIEIPKGSKAKYEIDKESGLLKLDRVLFSSVMYPANYGFIPQTYCDDKDPLDILVLCSIDVFPMSIIEAKVVGVMHMVDNGEQDDKIIAVAKNDMSVNQLWPGIVAGEWHNNHHLYPKSARAGFLSYQIDFAWYYIKFMSMIGAVSSYKDSKKQF